MYDSNTYLAHHGIKGQKWGVRRYQNSDGTLTDEGRRRLGYGEPKKSLKQKLAERKQAKEKTPEEKRAELKEYLRDHPKKLPKYRKELTQEEANEIINNINFDKRLQDIRKQEFDRGLDKIRIITNTMQTVANAVNTGKNVYNAYADVHNSLSSGKKLPKIGEKPEADKSFYKTLTSGTPDEIMKKLAKASDSDVKDFAARQKNIDAIRKSLYQTDDNKSKGSKKQSKDAEFDQRLSDIEDILEEIRNKK